MVGSSSFVLLNNISLLYQSYKHTHIYTHISVQFSRSVVSDSATHGLQHARPPCPSPTPGVYSSSCPLSQWCHPSSSCSVVPFSSRLQSFPASRSFHMISSSHQVAKGFSFNISPSNECLGLVSFRMDWFDLLAVQGTLKSLLQHHSSKVSILWRSAFFIVQLSHPYVTTGKTIALTRQTFAGTSGHEEIAHVQGQEQWLCFAGAAVKRYTYIMIYKIYITFTLSVHLSTDTYFVSISWLL